MHTVIPRNAASARATSGWPFIAVAVGLACLTLGVPLPAASAEQDLNLWSVFDLNHDFDDHWGASFQIEVRAQDDISELDAVILKPGGYYHFNEHVAVGVGYKFQAKNDEANEHDAWQELYLNHDLGRFSLGHQLRMEERFIGNVDGAIARLRYLLHFEHPITSSWYLAGSEAVRFNLNDQGEGPVHGFEQNRIYLGVGYRTAIARIEFGYLWRYELNRIGPDASDHVLRFQFLFDTKSRHRSKASN